MFSAADGESHESHIPFVVVHIWVYNSNLINVLISCNVKPMATVSIDLGMVISRPDSLLASAFRTHAMYSRSDKVHLLLKALLLQVDLKIIIL